MPSMPLPETLDLGAASEFAAQLLTQRGSDICLDGSPVRKLSAIGLEMLIAASAQWRADGHAFEISGWSDAAVETMSTLGADPLQLFGRG